MNPTSLRSDNFEGITTFKYINNKVLIRAVQCIVLQILAKIIIILLKNV